MGGRRVNEFFPSTTTISPSTSAAGSDKVPVGCLRPVHIISRPTSFSSPLFIDSEQRNSLPRGSLLGIQYVSAAAALQHYRVAYLHRRHRLSTGLAQAVLRASPLLPLSATHWNEVAATFFLSLASCEQQVNLSFFERIFAVLQSSQTTCKCILQDIHYTLCFGHRCWSWCSCSLSISSFQSSLHDCMIDKSHEFIGTSKSFKAACMHHSIEPCALNGKNINKIKEKSLIFYCIALFWIVLHLITFHCIVSHSIVMYQLIL